MRARTIIKHIMESQLTDSDIKLIWDALRHKDGMRRQVEVRQFACGDLVKWTSKKRGGQALYGAVERLNQKSVSVMTKGGMIWRVAPSFLTPVDIDEYNEAPEEFARHSALPALPEL